MLYKFIFLIILVTTINANSLKVAIASNVRFAFDDIMLAYEKKSGVKIMPIASSSGKLTAQIEQGAPFDLFLSANMKYPKYLHSKNMTYSEPKIYAYGGLVLWTLNKDVTLELENLKNKRIKKIAIPSPKNAPYGVEAVRLLEKKGLKEIIEKKIVWGESISQTSQYIYSRSADIGITAKSIVLSPRMKNKGKWIELDKNDYFPVEQGIVILKHGFENNRELSEDFYKFIFSETSKNIFKKYGYTVNE
ncbi:MAG: molybdate ABC transporter substrate-binding protein [Sulfurospirillum sp.]|nr:molybdate ABC transporter substrate-binding protein [Sulfurospirillum sp.]MBL0702582.1 molybdate ABC transporter substrate-binding protein [Sulfurospirillum sp.]